MQYSHYCLENLKSKHHCTSKHIILKNLVPVYVFRLGLRIVRYCTHMQLVAVLHVLKNVCSVAHSSFCLIALSYFLF